MTRVECSREGDVATVRLVTDGGVNVLSSRVLGELGTAVEKIAADAKARFCVFRGEGRTFVAGADIAEMSSFDEPRGQALSKHGHHVLDAVEAMPQITIAAINGHALGGGCELALAASFRVMVSAAKIGQPESRLGLIPGWGGITRLPRLIGVARAKRLLFSGEAIPADEAYRIGLVDEVVAADALDATLGRWIEAMRPGSPEAVKRIKRVLGGKKETEEFATCFKCSDAREGMTAFLEKRPPSWMSPEKL
ncbi:putative enoyl-CoA hydratase [Phycisphaerae bacterium RAS1]|nr:putative enoyl-CoA hydratase [Phycisphaerae bacterium RAS1]